MDPGDKGFTMGELQSTLNIPTYVAVGYSIGRIMRFVCFSQGASHDGLRSTWPLVQFQCSLTWRVQLYNSLILLVSHVFVQGLLFVHECPRASNF